MSQAINPNLRDASGNIPEAPLTFQERVQRVMGDAETHLGLIFDGGAGIAHVITERLEALVHRAQTTIIPTDMALLKSEAAPLMASLAAIFSGNLPGATAPMGEADIRQLISQAMPKMPPGGWIGADDLKAAVTDATAGNIADMVKAAVADQVAVAVSQDRLAEAVNAAPDHQTKPTPPADQAAPADAATDAAKAG